jgi:hypothetical protein
MSMHILEAEAQKLAEHDAQLYGQGFYRKRGGGLAEHIPASAVCVVTPPKSQATQQQAEPVGDENARFDKWLADPSRRVLVEDVGPALAGWMARAAQSGQRAGVADEWRQWVDEWMGEHDVILPIPAYNELLNAAPTPAAQGGDGE